MRPVRVYINVAVINHVNFVLNQLLSTIENSGLYDVCEEINLVVNGDIKNLKYKSLDKIKLTHFRNDISHCEFPTLKKIYDDVQNSDFNVLYLHTKGVTRYNKPIQDWIDYLIYFNITKFQDRIDDLNEHEASGVNNWGNPEDVNEHPSTWGFGKVPVHYSGNFWWSKSEHIKELVDPYQWVHDRWDPKPTTYVRYRMMAEMWICQIQNARYVNAWSSNVDHYLTEYPSYNYIKNTITI